MICGTGTRPPFLLNDNGTDTKLGSYEVCLK